MARTNHILGSWNEMTHDQENVSVCSNCKDIVWQMKYENLIWFQLYIITTLENTNNDDCETYIITISHPLLGSVWLYVWWFTQLANDRGGMLGSALLITMAKEPNHYEII